MSKGNVIDPLDMVDNSLEELLENVPTYDAARSWRKIRKRTETVPEQDRISRYRRPALHHGSAGLLTPVTSTGIYKRLEGYRNFTSNKLNANRFVLMTPIGIAASMAADDPLPADAGSRRNLNQTLKAFRDALDSYRFDIAAGILYEFTREPVLRLVHWSWRSTSHERWF